MQVDLAMFILPYMVHISVTVFFLLFFISIKFLFGSYSILHILREYKINKKKRKNYFDLFKVRENIAYHVGWAKSRGEYKEAKRLLNQLEEIDGVRKKF